MHFDPRDDQQWDDPYPVYRELRDADQLHYSPESEVFCVSRYDEALEVFRDPERFGSQGGFEYLFMPLWQSIGARDVFEMLRFMVRARLNPLLLRGAPESLISSDPPNHSSLRQIVNRGFTPRRIAAWEPRLREIADSLLDGLERQGRFDAVQTIAHPLPMLVIAELLGVDGSRLKDFRRWSNGIIDTLTGSDRKGTPGDALANGGQLLSYLRSVVEARRREPKDDLISVLVDPRHGDTLDTQAVLLFATLLLVAGNETTTNAIGSAIEQLLRDPELLGRVTEDPNLIPALVEETVRLESPFRFMPRVVNEDTEIRGTKLPKGSALMVMIGAANRDERHFVDPDRFDLDRDTSGHLGFGFGIHFCLGASLARLEAKVALESLLPYLQERELCADGYRRSDSFFTRGFSRLDVERIRAASAA
jgi:cytochrome P450